MSLASSIRIQRENEKYIIFRTSFSPKPWRVHKGHLANNNKSTTLHRGKGRERWAELEHKSTWSRLKVNLSHFLFSKAMEGAQGPFGQQQQVNHPTLPTTHPFQARRPLCRRICQTLSGMPDRCHANAVSSKTGKKAAPSRIVVLTSGVRE